MIDSSDRPTVLAERLFEGESPGERERVASRIAELLADGIRDYQVINAAKSVQDRRAPARSFMEATSSRERALHAAMAGAQIYPAPGVKPPSTETDREVPPTEPTICRVHMQRLYASQRDGNLRCALCERGA